MHNLSMCWACMRRGRLSVVHMPHAAGTQHVSCASVLQATLLLVLLRHAAPAAGQCHIYVSIYTRTSSTHNIKRGHGPILKSSCMLSAWHSVWYSTKQCTKEASLAKPRQQILITNIHVTSISADPTVLPSPAQPRPRPGRHPRQALNGTTA